MRSSLASISNLGFGLALTMLVGIALLSYGNTQNVAEAAESRRCAAVRLDQFQQFLAAAIDIETGERGYVVTGDTVFLEPYHSGIQRLNLQLQRLRVDLANQPRQQAPLRALEEAVPQLISHNGQVVAFKMNKDDASAQRTVASGRGKQIMDQIRKLIETLRAEENEQIHQDEQQYEASLNRSFSIIVVGSLVGFAGVGWAAVAINRSLRERTRLNTALGLSLAQNNRTLDQLHAASVELTRSNQELEQFAYVASHDLQEPLRKVSGFAQLLAAQYSDKLDADANEFIGYMVDGASRMQTLIQNLLAYSRLGRNGKPYAAVDGNKVLLQAQANLQMAMEESGAVIASGPLPTVLGDEVQLVQLFQNLLANAIKFCTESRPLIQVQAEPATGEGGLEWTFSVRDNGIGIDPQFAERIFLIFQRLHAREEFAGTGIGLAVCKKIVERHGGRIWVESQVGHGTAFRFTLPQGSV